VRAARQIDEAVSKVVSGLKSVTPDLGGSASTDEMGAAICAALEAL
jgi:isocitrate/isopropylmalate dehydrogenase